jgi:hypothetical protein
MKRIFEIPLNIFSKIGPDYKLPFFPIIKKSHTLSATLQYKIGQPFQEKSPFKHCKILFEIVD